MGRFSRALADKSADTLALLIPGWLAAASLSWPLPWFWAHGEPVWGLQLIAFIALYRALMASSELAGALRATALFSVAWLSGTIWWLYVAMHQYGGLPSLFALLAVLSLAMALAVFYVIAGGVWWRIAHRASSGLQALAFSAVWTLAEMARGTWFTGFGWGAVGYGQIDGPLRPWIPLVGVYGVAALTLWSSAGLADLRSTRTLQRLALLAVLLGGWWAAPLRFTDPTGTLQVRLLQGNIPQDEKFDGQRGVPLALQWYGEQLVRSPAELTLAPETAVPVLPQELPPAYWKALRAAPGPGAYMVGVPLGDADRGYTNSVLAWAPRPSVDASEPDMWRYDKHHLVPFGEFTPPWFKWFTRMMNIPLGDFERGGLGQASFPWHGQRIAANICYEDLFSEELAVRFADPARAPTAFANVSNLAWFGDTVAMEQHLQISRMRALEFERPVLRATNTGVTAVIDHRGRVIARLASGVAGVLDAPMEGRTGLTPYAAWVARLGLWPLWGAALFVLAWVAWRASKSGTEAPRPRP